MFRSIYETAKGRIFHGWQDNGEYVKLIDSKSCFLSWCKAMNDGTQGKDYYNLGTVYALEYENEERMIFSNATCYGQMSALNEIRRRGLKNQLCFIDQRHLTNKKAIQAMREWILDPKRSPWHVVLPFLTYHRDEKGRLDCIEADLTACPSQVLNNFFVAMRMPDKTMTQVMDWYALVNAGFTEYEAFIIISNVMSSGTQKLWRYQYHSDHYPLYNPYANGINMKSIITRDPYYNPRQTYISHGTYAPCNSIWGKPEKDHMSHLLLNLSSLSLSKASDEYTGSFPGAYNQYKKLEAQSKNQTEVVNFDDLVKGMRIRFDEYYKKTGVKPNG